MSVRNGNGREFPRHASLSVNGLLTKTERSIKIPSIDSPPIYRPLGATVDFDSDYFPSTPLIPLILTGESGPVSNYNLPIKSLNPFLTEEDPLLRVL